MSDFETYVQPLEDLGALHLRRPYAVIAFGGWIDGSWAATNALRYLIDRLSAPRIAELDPEPFYNFSDTRPRVVVREGGQRQVRWRQGRWHAAYMPDQEEHDLVLFIAPEPNLRWRTFSNVMIDLFQRLGTEALLTIGTVLAPMHHRARVPTWGWATNEQWRSTLRRQGIEAGTYEGPTGIATVLALAAQHRGLPALNLTASTPTYLGNTANPRTSLQLLRTIGRVLGLQLPLADLEQAVVAFDEQVDQFLTTQPELKAEIERLAEAEPEPEPEPERRVSESAPGAEVQEPELPSSGDVVRELEDFLKNLRETQGGNASDA